MDTVPPPAAHPDRECRRLPLPGGLLLQWCRALPGRARRLCLAPPWSRRCLVCREACLPPHAGAEGLQGAGGDVPDLCQACLASLPWLRSACGRCARPLPESAPACGACLRRPPPQAATRAAFLYAAPLDRLLPRLKFHQDLAAGRSIALGMAGAFADAPRPEVVVPLPLHRSRLRARGFDQALELARPLARALDLPLCPGLLQRSRETAPQSRLDAAARRRNVRDAFRVPPRFSGGPLPGHVALFDDVMTTGATVQAATHALLRAGVERVDVWVCARVA